MKKLATAMAIILLWNACKFGNEKKTLPIYGNRTPITKVVNGQTSTDTIYQTIPAFKFIDQYGDSISNKNLAGKIYVADFFFTTCPSICPIMQRNMLNDYDVFKNTNDVKILSYTIDPKHDSVAVLKQYADKLGIAGNTWWFLQGKKEDTYQLAEKNYLVAVKQDSTVSGGYIHQGYFVLIDKNGNIANAMAPQPSDPKAEQLINQLLAE